MSRLLGVFGVLVVLVLAMMFAALNGGQRVTLDLGLITLYRVPVTVVAFGGLFTGMVIMLVTGLHTDLRVRSILRERLAQEYRDEQDRIDIHQQDLFPGDEEGTPRT